MSQRVGRAPAGSTAPVLSVEDLWVRFHTEDGPFDAVRGATFQVGEGETVALVGESGCGKSVTALSIMGLLPEPQARVRRGRILFEGTDLARAGEGVMRGIRGNRIAMIFQEPMTSLNPVYTCGEQVAEAIRVHRRCSRQEARALALEAFRQVGIADPERRLDQYPHELSGGLRQRVMIAMAVACRPRLLIADEPTTALDVTIQAQILDLLRALQRQLGTSILFITHDLGVVAEMADRVVVMYAGEVVEEGPVEAVFRQPRHPYTAGLLRSIPRRDLPRKTPLPAIEGAVPHPSRRPPGCPFAPRCPDVMDVCRREAPPWVPVEPGRGARCWLHGQGRREVSAR
ncbi:MAG TPA: ABC transporter ATP-binding protein [Thermaerobacter sp.]